jgi:hypothetical protein
MFNIIFFDNYVVKCGLRDRQRMKVSLIRAVLSWPDWTKRNRDDSCQLSGLQKLVTVAVPKTH